MNIKERKALSNNREFIDLMWGAITKAAQTKIAEAPKVEMIGPPNEKYTDHYGREVANKYENDAAFNSAVIEYNSMKPLLDKITLPGPKTELENAGAIQGANVLSDLLELDIVTGLSFPTDTSMASLKTFATSIPDSVYESIARRIITGASYKPKEIQTNA